MADKVNSKDTKYTEHDDFLITGKKLLQSFKSKEDKKRTSSEKLADWMTHQFGSITFLMLNLVWFFIWIVWNLGLLPNIVPFDPFPFGLLTMIVSLEAIFLAIVVLISQNRASRIDELREEIDLKVDVITEQELTKLLRLTVQQMLKNGFKLSGDKELNQMTKPMDLSKIEDSLEKDFN